MEMKQLEELQQTLFFEIGFKVDIHCSEKHRGIIVVPHGQPLTPFNILKTYNF